MDLNSIYSDTGEVRSYSRLGQGDDNDAPAGAVRYQTVHKALAHAQQRIPSERILLPEELKEGQRPGCDLKAFFSTPEIPRGAPQVNYDPDAPPPLEAPPEITHEERERNQILRTHAKEAPKHLLPQKQVEEKKSHAIRNLGLVALAGVGLIFLGLSERLQLRHLYAFSVGQ